MSGERERIENIVTPRHRVHSCLPTTSQGKIRPLRITGALEAIAFASCRRDGATRTSPLPDYNLGAQAEMKGWTLRTRDEVRSRTRYPSVQLLAPS